MDLFKYMRPGLMTLALCCAAGVQADEPVPTPAPATETAAAPAGEATGCAGAENKTAEAPEGQGTGCTEKPDATKSAAPSTRTQKFEPLFPFDVSLDIIVLRFK